jgi:Ran GTPase-activating protein (RanGAP) involved in mRNA processing and transport
LLEEFVLNNISSVDKNKTERRLFLSRFMEMLLSQVKVLFKRLFKCSHLKTTMLVVQSMLLLTIRLVSLPHRIALVQDLTALIFAK